jgi:hypothetical protein
MPAPSVQALRDFEGQFDELFTGIAGILAPLRSAPYSLQVAGQNTSEDLTAPRLEFEVALNDPTGPDGSNLVDPSTGAQLAFAGLWTFRHVYDHTKTTSAATGAIRGFIRTLLSPEINAITAAKLPYLDIASLTETSSLRSRFVAESGKQLTEWLSTWAVSWKIRQSAWPV